MADVKKEEKRAADKAIAGISEKEPEARGITKKAIEKDRNAPIGPKLGFAAKEAYKLLRTNILFSFSDEKDCHAVGITSSIRGEGKSTTSINTAYMLAETGRHVLLVEADMRLPSASSRLGVSRSPGLSNLLVNQSNYSDAIRQTELHKNLYILPAGDIPPNPSELLGSEAMKKVLETLETKFDFVILDLPPVTAVSDALVVSKIVDGMIIVVCRDYSTRTALDETMAQLKNAEARVIGYVYTRSGLPGTGKYKYSKYKYSKYSAYSSHGK